MQLVHVYVHVIMLTTRHVVVMVDRDYDSTLKLKRNLGYSITNHPQLNAALK